MDDRREPIIIEQYFDLPVEKVWKAITEQEQMVEWFFADIPEFKAEKGFTTVFDVDSGRRIFRHCWKILEAEVPSKITYHWSYEDMEGEGFVTFELHEKENGTLLRLTNSGLESFPDDMPEFTRESCIGGWEYFIKGNLKNYLEK
ncbi:MAG: SRPBCC domain-containing protein [Flavobacteriaceae bacterium]